MMISLGRGRVRTMRRRRAKTVLCASADCSQVFTSRSNHAIQFCPGCLSKRLKENQRRFEEESRVPVDIVHDPELNLDKKLDNAEYSILYDAGPEEAAFRSGARLTCIEVKYLLKYESIAVNSILVHNQTGHSYRVLRDGDACLKLERLKAGEAARGNGK
jgi:hypothetical protein